MTAQGEPMGEPLPGWEGDGWDGPAPEDGGWEPDGWADEAPPAVEPAPEVVVTRSARRRKTLQARWQDGRVHVAVPAGMPPHEEERAVAELVGRVLRRRRNASSTASLIQRAQRLNRTYFHGVAVPVDVRWVANQRSRWGSCTPGRGTIRLSDRLQPMPDWVVDAVLVHELAHLLHRGHGPDFQAAVRRYPRYDQAMVFLQGVSHGWAHPEG